MKSLIYLHNNWINVKREYSAVIKYKNNSQNKNKKA